MHVYSLSLSRSRSLSLTAAVWRCRSEESFQQYFSEMPWLAVPYSDEARRSRLNRLYGIQGTTRPSLGPCSLEVSRPTLSLTLSRCLSLRLTLFHFCSLSSLPPSLTPPLPPCLSVCLSVCLCSLLPSLCQFKFVKTICTYNNLAI